MTNKRLLFPDRLLRLKKGADLTAIYCVATHQSVLSDSQGESSLMYFIYLLLSIIKCLPAFHQSQSCNKASWMAVTLKTKAMLGVGGGKALKIVSCN